MLIFIVLCISISIQATENSDDITIYVDAADFTSPPTIWAWIGGGVPISEKEGYTWNNQPKMSLDQSLGLYYWKLDRKYLDQIKSGLRLHFIINKIDEFSRNRTGCYNDNRWFESLDECINPPFTPYIGPFLTLLNPESLTSDSTPTVLSPATHMVINYELTSRPHEFVAKAYYRKFGESGWQSKAEDIVASFGSGWGKVHHITLKGLSPDTSYQYKVTGPNNRFSTVYSFKTAKASMDYSRFLVIGDMQDEQASQRWHDVAQAITSDHMDEFDFIITVGDMVKDDIPQNGDRFHWWKVFFDKGQDLFSRKPLLPAMGNHDTPGNLFVDVDKAYRSNAEDTRSFRKYFYINPDMSYPDYYSYSYGNACLMSVNSEIPVFYGRHPERDNGNSKRRQEEWLRREVNKAKDCDWSFAYWHVPPINPAGGKDEVRYLRPYTDYFNGKLDWSITGHVHEYQRLKPVFATEYILDFNKIGYGRDSNKGVGYLIAAPAGQWPRNYSSDQMSQLAFYPHNEHGVGYEIGFSIINVKGNEFSLKSYGMGAVGTQNQPHGYRANSDRSKQLLDSVYYRK